MAHGPLLDQLAVIRRSCLAAGVVALLSACTGGGSGAAEPAAPSVPSEFAATFDVESPLALVAGEGQAWVLRSDGNRVALSRIDHTGRATDVVRLPGQEFGMAPYGDGVVVTRRACAAEECEENAIEVLVVDAAGETVAEEELARKFGGLEAGGEGLGIELIGVQDDVVWLDTGAELMGHDLATGRTTTAGPATPGGVACLLGDGLYTLVVVDDSYLTEEMVIIAGAPDPVFDAEIRRLVDGAWEPVPDTRRGLTYREIELANCLGGGLQAAVGFEPGPVWSPGSGWIEGDPYRARPDLATAPQPTAHGSHGQLFVLESAGVIRRWFAGPDGPMAPEVLEVPADLFVQRYEPQVWLMFDASDTVLTGCVQRQQDHPSARCWIGSH